MSEAVTAPPRADAEAETLPGAAPGGGAEVVPETVGGYKLLRRLGGGGMGTVYEAEHLSSGRRAALKLVLPEYASAPEAVERFRQEGRLASTLAHPRCVFVLAADEEAGRPYIVMELMPGDTLDDLVRDKGPLPPEQAITKILDVIDGLSEAHRRGLVHRDVKPSNCFLEADGRVKIGDFGLARSLAADIRLTRTGTFLGTPLFAAPEQVKNEKVDAQSDVYSVAATLYFLLAGRAPFETGDALATLARIVSDDPPPLRSIRPNLPKALDRVVLRGLERDRKRRWRDLDEFRGALMAFLPVQPTIGGLWLRFTAGVIDFVLTRFVIGWALALVLTMTVPRVLTFPFATYGMAALILFPYYGVLEGVWGWSVGKRLLRLRVGTATGTGPPGVLRAMLRVGVLFFVFNLAAMATEVVRLSGRVPADLRPQTPEQAVLIAVIGVLNLIWTILAIALLVGMMRARNGFRGLHELLSGTRTYRLPWPQSRQPKTLESRPFELEVTHPEGLPERVGPFTIRGALRWTEKEKTLLAEDVVLGRTLWVWLRPADQPPLDAKRRDVSRATRIRWVACGREGEWQWDAFLAPAGMPLPVLASGARRLSWADARPILEELTEELAASCADGTLPASLTVHQVWVQAHGRVQLLGTPLTGSESQVSGALAMGEPTDSNEVRALRFLREVALVTLEGKPRPPGAAPAPVQAPVPVHAEAMLERLVGNGQPYATLEEWQQELEATRDRPVEVTRWRRLGHLALMTALLHIPFMGPVLMLGVSFAVLADRWKDAQAGGRSGDGYLAVPIIAAGCTLYWVVWAFLFRGGYAYWRGGLALRRPNGRKVSRLRCAFRVLLVWGPFAGLLSLAAVVAQHQPTLPVVYFALWGLAVLLLVGYAILAVAFPQRSWHDRLAGTYLVPD